MICKIIVIVSVALCVQGGEDAVSEQRVVIHHRGDSASHITPQECGNQDEYTQAYPSYEFYYNVNDPKTHDIKGHHETREGDEVVGNYWLIEPSGRKRTVNYQANDNSGFNAQIAYTGSHNDEQKVEEITLSQAVDSEQSKIEDVNVSQAVNSELNNEEGVELITVVEETKDTQENNKKSEDNNGEAAVEDSGSEQNELDSQKDEANNVNELNHSGGANIAKGYQVVEYLNENNKEDEPNLYKYLESRKNNNVRKGKRENSKKNKSQDRENIQNNHERPRNSKRVKQDDVKHDENNNKNNSKARKMNHDRNMRTHENINNTDGTLNKSEIKSDKEHKEGNQYRMRKRKTSRNRKQNDDFTSPAPSEKIERTIDLPNNEETFEHRIRIYHPKNISPTLK